MEMHHSRELIGRLKVRYRDTGRVSEEEWSRFGKVKLSFEPRRHPLVRWLLPVPTSLRLCFLKVKLLLWVVDLTAGTCWEGGDASGVRWGNQSVAEGPARAVWRQMAAQEKPPFKWHTLIWPSDPDRQVLHIQIACSTCRHPWANTHLYITYKNGTNRKTATVLGEITSMLWNISLWESTSSYARNRYGATKDKEGKGMDSNPQYELASLISVLYTASKIPALKSVFSLILYLGAQDWGKTGENLQLYRISAVKDDGKPVKQPDIAWLLTKT